MKAAVLRGGRVVVDDGDDPLARGGQGLVQTKGCGICGSDPHPAPHRDRLGELTKEATASAGAGAALFAFDTSRDLVMGHEFAAEVLEVGAGAVGPPAGATVVSMPVVFDQRGIHAVGYSNEYPGGYAERMVLSAGLLVQV